MPAFSRELRSFIVVAQSSSIREAADRLNISAPALSRQIKLLEQSYNVELFVRSSGGMALTSEGESLRDEAIKWIEADTKLSQRLRHKKEATALHLRLGVMEGLVATLLPALMDTLRDQYGDVEFDISVGSTQFLIEKSEALELDVIIAFNMPRLSRLIVTHNYEYPLGVVSAPTYGPTSDGPISLSQALEWPLCLPSSALSMHTRLLAEILTVRVNPTVAVSSNSISTLLTFLRAGKGVSFLTWLDVYTDVNNGQLEFRSLKNRRLIETLSLAICRGNRLGDRTGKIINTLNAAIEAAGR